MPKDIIKEAVAFIEGTTPESEISGIVSLIETEQGLMVKAEVFNVPTSGKHGFHIHENGSCDDAGNAAGGHFNPDKHDHGDLMADGLEKTHAGDFGNITIDNNGNGKLSLIVPLSLTEGNYNVMGKAIILHEAEDNFGQPTGNAGGRVACGIIEAVE